MKKRISNPDVAGCSHMVDNDDDRERAEIIKIAYLKANLSKMCLANDETYTKEEMIKHFETCLKLNTENKLSVKNVWHMKIIDYLTSMVQNKIFARETLKVATSTLELGGKIYGIKVDDIYSQGIQLACNMKRTAAKDNKDSESGPSQDSTGLSARKTRKPRVLRLLSDIESILADDPNNLVSIPKIYGASNVDISNDSGGKLLTLQVPLNSSQTNFRFMSEIPMDVDSKQEEVHSQETISLDFNVPVHLDLCHPFSKFNFLEWKAENEMDDLSQEPVNSPDQEDLVFDNHGFPIHELDGSLSAMPFRDLGSEEEPEDMNVSVEYIASLNGVDPTEETEYFYRSKLTKPEDLMQFWAGPKHWKLKSARSSIDGDQKCSDRKRSAADYKKPQMRKMELKFLSNSLEALRPKKSRRKSQTLPFNYGISLDSYKYAICKEGYVEANDEIGATESLAEAACIDFHNCDIDSIDDDNLLNDLDEIDRATNASDTAEIDVPDLVPISSVPYAKKAKRFDMKKLKSALLECISETQSDETSRKSFRHIYSQLNSKLDKSLQEVLTAPIAFVALLHLANEHNLLLIDNTNLDDVFITDFNS